MVLFFGLIRPYKGVDVLLDAWRRAERPDGAELWIVGMPRMDASFIDGPGVRTALRFVSGAELAGAFRAADLVVLPYREIDQSGVLFTALAFGKPLLLTAVGGFPEIAADRRRGARAARRPRRARRRADGAARRPGASDAADGRRGQGGRRRARTAGTRSPAARSSSTRGSRRRRRGSAARASPCAARGGARRCSRNPVRSATRFDGALSSWMSSSISSTPRPCAAQSRSSVTARVATPRPRARRRDPVADLAVVALPVDLHHAERADELVAVEAEEREARAGLAPTRPSARRRRPRARGGTATGTPVQFWISGSWHAS